MPTIGLESGCLFLPFTQTIEFLAHCPHSLADLCRCMLGGEEEP